LGKDGNDMLNGVAPILIFTFPPALGIDFSKILGGIPLIGSALSDIGIPVPIYLDEGLTGIYIESESHSLDIDTDITPKYEQNIAGLTTTTLVNQTGLNNLVTVNMLASKDSLILTVLLALSDMVFSRVTSGKYKIHYINKGTVVFGALLHSFQTSTNSEDTLLKITMQLQKNNQRKTDSPVNQYYNPPLKAAVGLP
jgi:hypothetical protein